MLEAEYAALVTNGLLFEAELETLKESRTFNPLLPMKWAAQHMREAVCDKDDVRMMNATARDFQVKCISLVRARTRAMACAGWRLTTATGAWL